MKLFFIFGRNPELSRAELFLYLEAREIRFKEIFFKDNLAILNLDSEIELNIQEFGGLLRFGRLYEFFNEKEMMEYLEKEEFVPRDKFSYSVIGNIDSIIFSNKFKRDRKKTQIKNSGKRLEFQSGEKGFIPKVDIEIFAHTFNSKFFLGFVENKFSSKETENRDMKKPERRESLAISPRIARILINLSGAKKGDFILDPFCGVGGIVQEAVLIGINCLGIDKDSEAIFSAKKNLSWLKANYPFKAKYDFLNINSLNAPDRQYDSIVTESSLGKVLRKRLNKEEKKKYLKEFVNEILPLLKKFKKIKKPKAKIAITFPCFEDVQISKEEILNLSELDIYSSEHITFPIVEKRKDQFVNRQIWLFY